MLMLQFEQHLSSEGPPNYICINIMYTYDQGAQVAWGVYNNAPVPFLLDYSLVQTQAAYMQQYNSRLD